MTKKKLKYLIDTSAVRPALGQSTEKHCSHFAEQTADGSLWTSVYIRMELIQRWFCTFADIAFKIEHFGNVSEALTYLEQDFSQRKNKAVIAAIAAYIGEIGPLPNARSASEEVAGLAMRWLKKFDLLFKSRITNQCACQIGGRMPEVDYNHLLNDLQVFYTSFVTPITDCEVNDFLALNKQGGKVARLLEDTSVQKLSAAQNVNKFRSKNKWITCTQCCRIGDVIIALEMPNSWSMIHVDTSFNELCRALKKKNKQISSVRALEKA